LHGWTLNIKQKLLGFNGSDKVSPHKSVGSAAASASLTKPIPPFLVGKQNETVTFFRWQTANLNALLNTLQL
jgi:hypothetical protein